MLTVRHAPTTAAPTVAQYLATRGRRLPLATLAAVGACIGTGAPAHVVPHYRAHFVLGVVRAAYRHTYNPALRPALQALSA